MLLSNFVSVFSSVKWVQQHLSHRCVVRLKRVNAPGELKTVVTRYIVSFIETLMTTNSSAGPWGPEAFVLSSCFIIYVTCFLLCSSFKCTNTFYFIQIILQ